MSEELNGRHEAERWLIRRGWLTAADADSTADTGNSGIDAGLKEVRRRGWAK